MSIELTLMICADVIDVQPALNELAAIRARVAELEAPKTCATCKWLSDDCDSLACSSPFTPVARIYEADKFGCIHHAPSPRS